MDGGNGSIPFTPVTPNADAFLQFLPVGESGGEGASGKDGEAGGVGRRRRQLDGGGLRPSVEVPQKDGCNISMQQRSPQPLLQPQPQPQPRPRLEPQRKSQTQRPPLLPLQQHPPTQVPLQTPSQLQLQPQEQPQPQQQPRPQQSGHQRPSQLSQLSEPQQPRLLQPQLSRPPPKPPSPLRPRQQHSPPERLLLSHSFFKTLTPRGDPRCQTDTDDGVPAPHPPSPSHPAPSAPSQYVAEGMATGPVAGSAVAAAAPTPLASHAMPGSGLSLAAVAAQFAQPPPPPPRPRPGGGADRPEVGGGTADCHITDRGGSGGDGGSDAAASGLSDSKCRFPEGSPFTAALLTLPPQSPPLLLKEEVDMAEAQAAAAAVLDAVSGEPRPGGWASPVGQLASLPSGERLCGSPGEDAEPAAASVLHASSRGLSPAAGATMGLPPPPPPSPLPPPPPLSPPPPPPPRAVAARQADGGRQMTGPRVQAGDNIVCASKGAGPTTVGAAPAAAPTTTLTLANVRQTNTDAYNPLRKEGRNLVITGKLPTTSPFQQAIDSVGIRFVSAALSGVGAGAPPAAEAAAAAVAAAASGREAAFLADHAAFMLERGHSTFKIPVVGGGPLNIFRLFVEVCKLGGVENVLNKRAFRVVAGELDLPRTCTSAAFVLRNAHESLLYAYEQQLVFGRTVSPSDRPVRKGVDGKKKKKKAPPLVPPLALGADNDGERGSAPEASRGAKGAAATPGVSPAAKRRPSFPSTLQTSASTSKTASAVGQLSPVGAGVGRPLSSLPPAAGQTAAGAMTLAATLHDKASFTPSAAAAALSGRRRAGADQDGEHSRGGHAPNTPTTTIIGAAPQTATLIKGELMAGKTPPLTTSLPPYCPPTRWPLRPLPATPPPRRPAPIAASCLDDPGAPANKRLKILRSSPRRAEAAPAAAATVSTTSTTTATAAASIPTIGASAAPDAPGDMAVKEGIAQVATSSASTPLEKKPTARRPRATAANTTPAPSPSGGGVAKARAPRPARKRPSRAGRSAAAKRERDDAAAAAAATAAAESTLADAHTRAILAALTLPGTPAGAASGATVGNTAATGATMPPSLGVSPHLPPLPPLAVNVEALNAALRQYAAGAAVPGLLPSVFEEAHAAAVAAGAGAGVADYLPAAAALSAATACTATSEVGAGGPGGGGGEGLPPLGAWGGNVGGGGIPPPLPPPHGVVGYGAPPGMFPCFRPLSSSPLPPLPWARPADDETAPAGTPGPVVEEVGPPLVQDTGSSAVPLTHPLPPQAPPPWFCGGFPPRALAECAGSAGAALSGASATLSTGPAADGLLSGAALGPPVPPGTQPLPTLPPPPPPLPPLPLLQPASATELRMSYMSGWFFSSHHKVYSPDDYILDSPSGADSRDG